MKTVSRRYILTCMASLMAVCMVSACSSDKNSETSNYEKILSNDSIPDVIKSVVKAVYENDSEGFAKVVDYPLQRPYPLKDIMNEDEMKAYYPVLVDDSLRNVITDSSPADWQEYGWRGYSLKDGSYLWIGENIYDVGYVSAKEQAMIDSLSLLETNSLPEQIRQGWQPVLTLLSNEDGKIYRIDIKTETREAPVYRLSIYNHASDKPSLGGMPDEMINGYMTVEGSANVVSYIFHGKEGNDYIISPDDPSSGSPILTLPDGGEEELQKAYWYELIK